MYLFTRHRRWAALILTWMILLAGVHLGYEQGQASGLSWRAADRQESSANTVVRPGLFIMEACGAQEAPSWKKQPSSSGVRYAGGNGGRRALYDFCAVRPYSGAPARIRRLLRRADASCASSHALMMCYIHCQDGAKPYGLFSVIA